MEFRSPAACDGNVHVLCMEVELVAVKCSEVQMHAPGWESDSMLACLRSEWTRPSPEGESASDRPNTDRPANLPVEPVG